MKMRIDEVNKIDDILYELEKMFWRKADGEGTRRTYALGSATGKANGVNEARVKLRCELMKGATG